MTDLAASLSSSRRAVLAADGDSPYSQAGVWGDLVFTAGQVGRLDPVAPDVETQARQALDALERVLVQTGASLETVLRVEAFLRDAADFEGWNRAYRERFPSAPPARTTVTTGFVLDGLRIEIQAVAGRLAAS
jgi:2-iminobutanoate/2-iminopropanoate deaminase